MLLELHLTPQESFHSEQSIIQTAVNVEAEMEKNHKWEESVVHYYVVGYIYFDWL